MHTPSLSPGPVRRSEEPRPGGALRVSICEEGVGGIALTHRAPGVVLIEVWGRLRLPLWDGIEAEYQRALASGHLLLAFVDLRAHQALDPALRERAKVYYAGHKERFGPASCLVSSRLGAMLVSVMNMALNDRRLVLVHEPARFFSACDQAARARAGEAR